MSLGVRENRREKLEDGPTGISGRRGETDFVRGFRGTLRGSGTLRKSRRILRFGGRPEEWDGKKRMGTRRP